MTVRFEKIEREPAYRQVSKAIEKKILSRILRPGDSLPSEAELAQQFGLNRSTIREGLRQLETGGLINRRQGSKKFFVHCPSPNDVAAGVSRAMHLNEVTFAEVWQAMMILEPECARLVAEKADKNGLAKLGEVIDRLATQGDDFAQAVDQAVEFFRLLAELTGNRVLVLTQAPLCHLLRPSLVLMVEKVPQARQRIKHAQGKILEACSGRRMEEAQDWMRKHIVDFKRGYMLAGIELDQIIDAG
ncbi:MAG: FadR family transcriptional regulator [Alphaproteobacteria bacterium]|nr:MAG: FadR family transcriptional regulator [Alphaproteobacteria bacterium]